MFLLDIDKFKLNFQQFTIHEFYQDIAFVNFNSFLFLSRFNNNFYIFNQLSKRLTNLKHAKLIHIK